MDEPYGWLIVLSGFLQYVLVDGLQYTFGIISLEIGKEFPEVGKPELSLILALILACTNGGGPFGGMLINKFGLRKVSMLGSLLTTIGFTATYWAPTVHTMYFTLGVLGGFGFSLLYMTAVVSVPAYFDKRLSIAIEITYCGTGVGTFAFEWAFGLALTHYNWRTIMLVMGGLRASTSVLSLLHVRTLKKGTGEEGMCRDHCEGDGDLDGGMRKPSFCSSLLDWDLLRNPQFVLIVTAQMLLCTGYYTPYIYWPEAERNFTLARTTSVLGFIAGGTMVGRIVLGFLNDIPWVNARYLMIVFSAVGAICMFNYVDDFN